MEGMRGCSRLSCIKSAIEYLVHREFHSHKRPARDVSHNLQGWARERGTALGAERNERHEDQAVFNEGQKRNERIGRKNSRSRARRGSGVYDKKKDKAGTSGGREGERYEAREP